MDDMNTDIKYSLIMEYMEGGTLYDLIHDPSIEITKTRSLYWMISVARGMKHLHSFYIVHKNLTSRNVMLDAKGVPKITDYGLCNHNNSDSLGESVFWMAPEILRTKKYTKGSDIWSYGMFVFEIVCREVPYKKSFHSNRVEEITANILENKTPPLPTKLSSQLRDLLTLCWSADPEIRPSFDRICHQLDR